MPRDYFQYLIEVCQVFVAANGAGGFNERFRLLLGFARFVFHSGSFTFTKIGSVRVKWNM